MCSDSNLTKLYRLIDDSLRPYTEPDVVSVTKEGEILVSLSQILRQVKLWIGEVDSDSDNGVVIGLDFENECMCLSKILTHLIVLLTVESQYVKHLACNVLAVVSEFVAASGSHWDAFIRLLCDCMDLAITAAVSCSTSTLATGASDLCSSSLSLILVLKPKVKNGDWSVAAGVVRVLRDILKYLKSEDDDKLVEVFIEAVNSFLSTVPWELLHEIRVGPNADALKCSTADVSFQRTLFLGNLIQFLCSLVEQGGVVDAPGGSLDKHHPVFSRIINLVPKLLRLSLGEQADCVISNNCISQYFKHKLLVLMIRLIVQTCPESSILVSWLQLIHYYFEELLRQPISTLECNQEDCLEGSPFLSSVSDSEVNSLSPNSWRLLCLRKVCDSWSLFVEFPPSGQAINRSSCKKRKVSLNGSSFCGADLFALVKDSGGLFLEDECDDENKYDFKHTRENFQKTKECLISLKNSIESLHQKNLFPYNPNALLNRLMRFQELCFEEEK